MAHEKPSYYRYVSSITITNAGSGYSSPPEITISGGGGTGATATCTIIDGSINTVTVTNIGSGYTSTPAVAVSGSGGAVLTAVTSFAGGTPSSITRKSKVGIKYTIPEYIRTEYANTPSFVTFLEKYYEYMDQEGSPINILLNKRYYDIDAADEEELDKWRSQLAHNFPKSTNIDRLTLYKNLKSIYESKGSKRSIQAFFKVVYDEDIELIFPSQYVLRASDGVWIEDKSVRAFSGYENYEVLELKGDLVDIVYYETTGTSTVPKKIPAEVNNVGKIAYTAPQKYDLVLGLPGTTTSIPGPGAQASASATVVAGEVTDFTISNGGYQYTAAPTVELYDTSASPGSGFEGVALVEDGAVTSITILDGGSGYSTVPGDVTVVFNTDNVRSFIVDRGATLVDENVRAYLDRTLATVTSNTYVGSNAGFKVGDVFRIQETGDDGRGYAIDYFAQDYVFIGGGNNAIIRVRELDTSNVPTTWEIINSGSGFLNYTSTITITSDTGEDLDLTITTNYLYLPAGRYKDDRGKLSDVNKLQDNNKWQSYSYIVKSGLPKSVWETSFKQVGHIAGMEVFGDLVLTSELDYTSTIDIVSPGLELYFFEFDEVAIDDTSISFDFDKTLSDSATASEADSKTVGKVLSDSTNNVVNADVGGQNYFAEDYVDNEYYVRDVGFFIVYSKALTDAATASEIIAPVTTWDRSFTDTATASESIQTLLEIQRSLSDSASVAESSVFSLSLNPSDSATTSENINSFDIDKILSDTLTASELASINTSKPLTDTANVSESDAKNFTTSRSDSATTSDSGTINGPQDYVDVTYFAEDYMVGVTLGTF